MDFSKLFDLKFWFNMNPGIWQSAGQIVLIAVVALIILGIVAKIITNVNKFTDLTNRLVQKLSSVVLFFGGFGLFFWLARQQRVPIFSARFWWIVLIAVVISWGVVVLIKAKKYKENKQRQQQKAEVYDKYLP